MEPGRPSNTHAASGRPMHASANRGATGSTHRQCLQAIRPPPPWRNGSSARAEIVKTFTASRAQLLLLECPSGFANTPAWKDRLLPRLRRARCTVEDATLYATDVGVPTGKQRVFAVAVKRRPGVAPELLTAKLSMWKQRLQDRVDVKPTVGALLKRKGCLFLKRLPGDERNLQLFRAHDHPDPRTHHGSPTATGGVPTAPQRRWTLG